MPHPHLRRVAERGSKSAAESGPLGLFPCPCHSANRNGDLVIDIASPGDRRLAAHGELSAEQFPASISDASVSQPSLPPQTRQGAVAQRWPGAGATEGKNPIRGRWPITRLRTCQARSWKIGCTAFLFVLNSPATVRRGPCPTGTSMFLCMQLQHGFAAPSIA